MTESVVCQKPIQSKALDKGLLKMAFPMLLEQLIFLTIPLSDAIFLSKISDEAVVSVGIVFPFIIFVVVVFNAVAIGANSIIGRFIGAEKYNEAKKTFGVFFSIVIFSIIMAIPALYFLSPIATNYMNLLPAVKHGADIYVSFASVMLIAVGIKLFYKTVLDIYGYPIWNMYTALMMFILNILFNTIVVFQLFGIPKFGLVGVAFSSVLATFLSLFFAIFIVHKNLKISIPYFNKIDDFKNDVLPIIKIGFPSSLEPILFQTNTIILNLLIVNISAVALTIRIYSQNIFSICLIITVSLAVSSSVIIAQLIGKKEYNEVDFQLKKCLKISVLCACIVAFLLFYFGEEVMGLFSNDEDVISMVFGVFLIYFLTEPARTTNAIVINALRATGDVWFVTTSVVLINWVFGLSLVYFLGFVLDLGLIGILIAILLDEYFRAGLMLYRWNQKKWKLDF